MTEKTSLAIHNGTPIRHKKWTSWPPYNDEVVSEVTKALKSGRWAISGSYVESPLLQHEFSRQFAAFNKVNYCLLTASGSSALVVALEALDVGPGDEVIVPIWTWVATATSVLRVNATPVFVDVDPDTFCMSSEAARSAITSKTKAIIPVHLHHSMADMDAFDSLSKETGIPIIEDAAQAHGAIWRGRRAGSIGRLGIFSFQQSKVITSGEGGAVITNDKELYIRLQELSYDSRRWNVTPQRLDDMQLVSSGHVMGANYCISEIQAAILLSQLPRLEEQLETRAKNANYLDKKLASLNCVYPLCQPAGLDRRTVYEYIIRIDRKAFKNIPIEVICEALKAELQMSFYPADALLHRSLLYQPSTKKRFNLKSQDLGTSERALKRFPVAESLSSDCIICQHPSFLGTYSDMDDIVAAFEKVLKYAHTIQIHL